MQLFSMPVHFLYPINYSVNAPDCWEKYTLNIFPATNAECFLKPEDYLLFLNTW